MIIDLGMKNFQLELLKLFGLRLEGYRMSLFERNLKSLKNVDESIQSAKDNLVLSSVMNGVDPFRIV